MSGFTTTIIIIIVVIVVVVLTSRAPVIIIIASAIGYEQTNTPAFPALLYFFFLFLLLLLQQIQFGNFGIERSELFFKIRRDLHLMRMQNFETSVKNHMNESSGLLHDFRVGEIKLHRISINEIDVVKYSFGTTVLILLKSLMDQMQIYRVGAQL